MRFRGSCPAFDHQLACNPCRSRGLVRDRESGRLIGGQSHEQLKTVVSNKPLRMTAWRLFVSQELENYKHQDPILVSCDSMLKTLKGAGAPPTLPAPANRSGCPTTGLQPLSRVFCGLLRGFFTDFFFNFTAPVVREPGTQHAIEQIRQEKHCRHPLVIHHCKDEDENDRQKPWNRFFRFPINRFEARILKTAKHHEGKEEQ